MDGVMGMDSCLRRNGKVERWWALPTLQKRMRFRENGFFITFRMTIFRRKIYYS
jgi:hypothetical protein